MLQRSTDTRIADALPTYLQDVTGATPKMQRCPKRPLPAYLEHGFDFACGEVLGAPVAFALARADLARSPAALAHHVKAATQAFQRPVVLVLDSLPARDRQRLVKMHVPFIVPFIHAYLPDVFIDARETARPRSLGVGSPPDAFAPSTQLVLLSMLLRPGAGPRYGTKLAEELGLSSMTVSRALKDLEASGLLIRSPGARPRTARLIQPPRETWQRAIGQLRSPVKARHLVSAPGLHDLREAGLTALARLSGLAPSRTRTVAVSRVDWTRLREEAEDVAPYRGVDGAPDQTLVEVWSYEPARLTDCPYVDVLSLYLSLREEQDERVELALEQALSKLSW